MSYIVSNIRRIRLLFLCLCFGFLFITGCSKQEAPSKTAVSSPTEEKALRDNTPVVHSPEASGECTYESDLVTIDVSNANLGYILLTYHGSNEKVKFQIQAPNDVTYTYLVSETDTPMVYPLTGENGLYLFTLLESVDVDKNLYAIVFTETIEVMLEDAFLPYLTPNIYVTFHENSPSVSKGTELAKGCTSDLEVIGRIYDFVIKNISYDTDKAVSVSYGYIPNPDETLETKEGICFDYASLMTVMLRSQRIPTRLEVGYVGETYHAWISCYVEEIGWVDRIIEFDGKNWSLMDPTLAANNDRDAVQNYIGDGSNYTVKYIY